MLLNLKYRPRKFSDLIGQEHIAHFFKTTVAQGLYAPAYLFTGPSGTGKSTSFRIIAMAILCDNKIDGEPCGVCASCEEILKGSNLNYREMDAASNGNVDDIRDLVERSSYGGINSKKNIVVLDEAHSMSKAGQNAILKLLEEGTRSTIYFFATTDPDKILHTVRARCMEFRIKPVTSHDITLRLKYICDQEQFSYEIKALQYIAELTKPHFRDAINQMEQLNQLGGLTEDLVKKQLNIGIEEEIIQVLLSLDVSPNESIEKLEAILLKISVKDCYIKLSEILLETYKYANLGIKTELVFININSLTLLYNLFRDKCLDASRYFLKQTQTFKSGLICDLLNIRSFCANAALVDVNSATANMEEGLPKWRQETKLKKANRASSDMDKMLSLQDFARVVGGLAVNVEEK